MRTVPVNQFPDPVPEGWEPARLISIVLSFLKRPGTLV